MIDFNRLRPDPTTQREPFEGLICGLARRFPPAEESTFNWVAGAGGDGGVEAYWTTTAGDEVGYQAKYHLHSRDIDWAKIDRSVETALKTHPRLTRYVIAIACDLTDTVVGRETSGRHRWKTHKAKWEATASERGMTVVFEFWGASEIEDRLTQPCCRGLRSYWLGELELDPSWFRSAFERAAVLLDERYQPDDHVEVDVEQTFGGLLRDHRLRQRFVSIVEELQAAAGSMNVPKTPEILDAMNGIQSAVAVISDAERGIPDDPTCRMDLELLRQHTAEIEKTAQQILDLVEAYRQKLSADLDAEAKVIHRECDRAYGSISSALQRVQEMDDFLVSDIVRADEGRFVLATGRAGTGKSHILAAEVDSLTGQNVPAVMMLGSQFSDAKLLSSQVPTVLGLAATWDSFLDTMNAAAEAAGARGLVAIDAINEGGGRKWRDELLALARDVIRRPWLSFVYSCRTEYVPYLVPKSAQNEATELVVEGFTSVEEHERAAQVYLDGRGILRPATPWLSPEFTNPLFLRTTANALQQMDKSEYPSGLHGTKQVLRFYLDAVGRHLGTDRDGSDDLVAPLIRAVRSMAREMARTRSDHVERRAAERLADEAFSEYANPVNATWLEVVHRCGVLRRDPPPLQVVPDPLEMPDDVVRFSFQRFQDHLVAEALHDEINPSEAAFAESGALSFMIDRHHGKARLSYEWRTVMQALWITHAEKCKAELVDLLPDDIYGIFADDFIETLLWRSSEAFTDRTLEIFNEWVVRDNEVHSGKHLGVLLQFGLRDHPWNADLLDENLQDRTMPERDEFWTLPLAWLGRYDTETSTAHSLARWCNGPAVGRAGDVVLARALVLLGWIFTTTDRTLRDVATKGAIAILLDRPALLSPFVQRFARVDDPYVLERVAAACAGTCLRDPQPARVAEAATAIYDAFFKGKVPSHLLTRDYARSIIELAHDRGVLPEVVEIDQCRPPYGTVAPAWPESEEAVERQLEGLGGQRIFSSCMIRTGDFGRYVIKHHVEDFSTVPLGNAPSFPAPNDDTWNRYDLRQRFKQDAELACLWVADRAFSLGWTKDRFPDDVTIDNDRHRGGRIERIGKKYQWIAFHELLARLADNFWIIDEYRPPVFHQYNVPTDVPFVRDVEITMPLLERRNLSAVPEVSVEITKIGDVPEEAWANWVFDNDVPKTRLREGSRPHADHDDWCVLYRHSSARSSWPKGETSVDGIPTRQEEFWFQMMVGLPKGEATSITRQWERRHLDFHEWLPENQTDRGYLYELGHRKTWNEGKFGPDRGWGKDADAFRQFTVGYHWERHLDLTLPEGMETHLPSPWLVEALGLQADPNRPGLFRNVEGAAIVISMLDAGDRLCMIRKSEVEALLVREEIEPVWLGIGERSVYPREESAFNFMRRRWNGIFVPSKTRHMVSTWFEDTPTPSGS